jgi:phosphomannomutase
MTLIKSISGIRGTIGGFEKDNLTPIDLVKFVSAYSEIIKKENPDNKKVVVGRDARISGEMVKNIVVGTLNSMGLDVVNIGLASTPTTEIAVVEEKAAGGIILTASHNPKQWNALKLLNSTGEFFNAKQGELVLELAEKSNFEYSDVDSIGFVEDKDYTLKHIEQVKNLPLVDVEAIRKAGFTVAVDGINSVGGRVIPHLLEDLGVRTVFGINCEPTGHFAHNPEPLKENLTEIMELISNKSIDLGFVVDPDVDRLAIIDENGDMFGEEYTLVSVADYILAQNGGGNTVSNLSSTRALRDVTEQHGGTYAAGAVGEVNVVEKMRETDAIIGGEGNGGIIYPSYHAGRDALVGVALFLTHLAKKKMKCSELRKTYPAYFMSKNKIELKPEIDVDKVLSSIEAKYTSVDDAIVNTIDGVKIDFEECWVHLRKSNTEPIIRIYTESKSSDEADQLAERFITEIKELI